MKDKWLKDLRDGLSDYEMDAPEGLWESLQEDMSLGNEPSLSALPEQSDSRSRWYHKLIVAASLAVALTVGTILGLWFGKGRSLDSDEIKAVAENRGGIQNDKRNIPQDNDNGVSSGEETTVKGLTGTKNNTGAVRHITGMPPAQTTIPSESENRKEEAPSDIDETTGDKNADECEIREENNVMREKTAGMYGPRKQTQNQPARYADLRLNMRRNKTKESRCYVGFITSGMSSTATDMRRKINNPNYTEPDYIEPGNNNPGQNPTPDDIDSANPDPGNNSSDGLGDSDEENPNPTTPGTNTPDGTEDDNNSANSGPTVPDKPVPDEDKYIDEITKVRHRQPVRFGLTFQYNFNKRFGIETGVMYTRLSSDVTTYSVAKTETGNQTLHYVGVPLNIKFSAWSWKCFDLYLSAGVTGEKCVRNELVTSSIDANTYEETKSLHGERPFQWSANFGAGLLIKLASTVGIFAEPGVSYYFDDGSSVSTIYKEKPCNFNLNLGIRFTFGN